MAKIQVGALITNITGSILGWTFQNNGSGLVARARGNPSRASTAKQQQAHQTHQRRLFEWSNLALADRLSWNLYASLYQKQNKFGVSKKITGANWYETTNTSLETIGEPITSTPPAHILPPAIPNFTILIVNNSILITFDTPVDASIYPVVIWGTAPTSRSTLSVNQLRKRLKVVNDAVYTTIHFAPEYTDVFGYTAQQILAEQNKNIVICVQLVSKVSGIASPFLCSQLNVNPPVPPPAVEDSFYYYT